MPATLYLPRPCRRDSEKVGNCIASLSDVATTLRRSLDVGLTTLSARLTPRLRSALNAFEGAASLIQYELSEEAFALSSAGAEGHNAFGAEFLPVLASILAPLQASVPGARHVICRRHGKFPAFSAPLRVCFSTPSRPRSPTPS